jgi:saccharopine dehydrogenase (NAD+, L-lysine-forming)
MSPSKIIILGGYGNTGRALARLMLAHSKARLVLAGRSAQRAEAQAAAFNQEFPGKRVRAVAADAADRESLRRALEGMDIVVAASSTSPEVAKVAEVALEAGLDYLDPQFSRAKVEVLQAMAPRIQAAGRCFITDGGFHPGLPAALVRLAEANFDRLHSATVGSVIQIDWKGLDVAQATIDELVEEFRHYQSLHFTRGRWHDGLDGILPPGVDDLRTRLRRRYTMPMFLEELRPLPISSPICWRPGSSSASTGLSIGC